MTNINDLVIDQIELQAAQYIPFHDGHCIYLHGHTYLLTDIHIGVLADGFLDFGKVKKMLKDRYDHVFFVPIRFAEAWMKLNNWTSELGCKLNIVAIPGDNTVEEQSWEILKAIRSLDPQNIVHIKFKMTEGLHQGVVRNWWLEK